ncbi:hypothetical protein [Rhizobium indigoferae]|uniref:DUF3551 domain-containing protein n=1 Tax=Rhizobium indigoferae TaxID=158891 RepID=A0ABZ0ZGW4_9HYPH|nr:hypothetical protein [Rhizobium indigoferae]NNU56140.1 hypothetical protein [Rhizobium indigoferae]WQN37740.1 hypothetical protein U5G49_002878 [Rhizobium indigoferae]GLR59334.1 hypothetical protein GCM10007919_40610 [Rhizobium indigoferae]
MIACSRKALLIVMMVAVTAGDVLAASNCQIGPECRSKGAKMNPYIQRAQRYLSGGGADAAIAAYCVNLAQAEIARICADELANMGNQSCAKLAYRQSDENKRVADGSLAAAKATSPGGFSRQKACGF